MAGLFSRRGFNITSLAVGPTEHPTVSRMTIVVEVEDLPLEQVTKQLNKLVNVLKIVELDPTASVQRELLLVKVKADLSTRSHVLETVQLFRAKVVDVASDAVTRPQVLEIVELFRAQVVDVTPEALVIELVAGVQRTAGLLKMLEQYGIRELAQSGLLAMGRGPKSITERIPR